MASAPGRIPISLSMPLSEARIEAARILPWLANLLPETHLTEIGQQIGVSPQAYRGRFGRVTDSAEDTALSA